MTPTPRWQVRGAAAALVALLWSHPAAAEPVAASLPPPAPTAAPASPPPASPPHARSPLGGYAAPVVTLTPIAGSLGVLVGGRGALSLWHQLGIGGGGFGLVNGVPAPAKLDAIRGRDLGFDAVGFWLEVVLWPGRRLHATLGTFIGSGTLTVRARRTSDVTSTQDVSLLWPEAGVELSLGRWVRVGASLGYRSVSGVSLFGLGDGDLSGVCGSLLVKLGQF